MTGRLDAEQRSRLARIAQTWTFGDVVETPARALERSLARFDFSDSVTINALETLLNSWSDVIPSLDDCREHILTHAFADMGFPPHAISAGLTVSAPSSGASALSLGWAERRWRSDGSLAAKIRVSAYFDFAGRLYWDFGVAGRKAPPISSLRRGVRAAAEMATAFGASLDLTPSHRKAAWLALRLGGSPANRVEYIRALLDGRWEEVRHNTMTFSVG